MSSSQFSNTYRPARPSPLSASASSSDSEESHFKTPKMSITQTHILARKARSKLALEAGRSNHEMRRLVGHANLLDVLIRHIFEAETEQEQWFNDTIQDASASAYEAELSSNEQIGWLPVDETLYDSTSSDESDDYDDEDDYSDDEPEYTYDLSRSLPKAQVLRFETAVGVKEISIDGESDSADSDEDDEGLFPLRRTSSNSLHTPPALVDDSSSSEDEDASNPPSPKQTPLEPSELPWLKARESSSIPRFFPAAPQPAPSLVDHEAPLYGTMIDSY